MQDGMFHKNEAKKLEKLRDRQRRPRHGMIFMLGGLWAALLNYDALNDRKTAGSARTVTAVIIRPEPEDASVLSARASEIFFAQNTFLLPHFFQ